MKKINFDVIIPVFNNYEYLQRCVNSIMNNNYSNLSIILVDDGSTDKSGKLLDTFIKQYQNVQVIHKSNRGVASARNRGLQLVKGDYFTFIDPDDWISNDYFSKAAKSLHSNSVDILIFPYIRYYQKKTLINNVLGKRTRNYNKNQIENIILKRMFGLVGTELNRPLTIDNLSPVWGKFYRSQKFSQVKFSSTEEVYSEDLWFNLQCFSEAQVVCYNPTTYYYYFKGNEDSFVKTYHSDILNKYKNLYRKMKVLIIKQDLDISFNKALTNRIVINQLTILRNISNSNLSLLKKHLLISKVLKDKLYGSAYNQFELKQLPFQYRLFYYVCKHQWAGITLLLLLIGEQVKSRKE